MTLLALGTLCRARTVLESVPRLLTDFYAVLAAHLTFTESGIADGLPYSSGLGQLELM